MVIRTRAFGSVELAADQVVLFYGELAGCRQYQPFALLEDKPRHLTLLMSLEDTDNALRLVDAATCWPEYIIPRCHPTFKRLRANSDRNLCVFFALEEDGQNLIANMNQPILVDFRAGIGLRLSTSDAALSLAASREWMEILPAREFSAADTAVNPAQSPMGLHNRNEIAPHVSTSGGSVSPAVALRRGLRRLQEKKRPYDAEAAGDPQLLKA